MVNKFSIASVNPEGRILQKVAASVDSRTGPCQRHEFLPANGLARPETGPRFFPTTAHFAR
jgi:hypothetical protein